eukprot:COSAG04_NODE_5469_length_1607_cov_1.685676_2_plen_276_part_00
MAFQGVVDPGHVTVQSHQRHLDRRGGVPRVGRGEITGIIPGVSVRNWSSGLAEGFSRDRENARSAIYTGGRHYADGPWPCFGLDGFVNTAPAGMQALGMRPAQVGDRIGLLLDLTKGEKGDSVRDSTGMLRPDKNDVKVFVNDKYYGRLLASGWPGLTGPLCWMVIFHGQGTARIERKPVPPEPDGETELGWAQVQGPEQPGFHHHWFSTDAYLRQFGDEEADDQTRRFARELGVEEGLEALLLTGGSMDDARRWLATLSPEGHWIERGCWVARQ